MSQNKILHVFKCAAHFPLVIVHLSAEAGLPWPSPMCRRSLAESIARTYGKLCTPREWCCPGLSPSAASGRWMEGFGLRRLCFKLHALSFSDLMTFAPVQMPCSGR